MKKNIVSILIVFVFGLANAQTKKEILFGVKGGLNIATLIGDVGDVKSKLGYHIGVFSEIKISNKFSVQPEILYSSQGIKFNNVSINIGGIDYSAEGKINLSYLNIPLMAKYYVAKKFSLVAGPQIGFLTSAKTEGTLNGEKVKQNVKDNFKSIDFGLNFGAEYEFYKNISTGIRYDLGLLNIVKTPPGENSKARNSIVSLSMSFNF